MMEVKKTVLFTFFKAPKSHVNNAADKQENFSKNEETLIFLSAPKVMFMCCVASTFYGNFFFKQVILAEFRCPQATVSCASVSCCA